MSEFHKTTNYMNKEGKTCFVKRNHDIKENQTPVLCDTAGHPTHGVWFNKPHSHLVFS